MKSWARIRAEIGDRLLGLWLSGRGRQHSYPEVLALRRLIAHYDVDCVIDVGANAGQYARMLRGPVGFTGTILSFEPNPAVFERLERRAARDPRWHVFNLALSDTDGTAAFHITAADQFSSLNRPSAVQDAVVAGHNRVAGEVMVTTRRLDGLLPDLAGRYGLARPLLKLDTQGHDRAVCEGAGETLGRMLAVQTELSMRPLYEGATDWRAMIDWLGGRGFAPSALFANNKGHFPLLIEMDGLFVRRDLLGGDAR